MLERALAAVPVAVAVHDRREAEFRIVDAGADTLTGPAGAPSGHYASASTRPDSKQRTVRPPMSRTGG